MSHHTLLGRSDDELLWFRRRSFLQAAAAWTALGGYAGAQAQQRSNVVQLQGDALLNGQRMTADNFVQTGDQLQTGPDSHVVFVIGNAAFQVRPNSSIAVERGETLNVVSILRLVTGAVVSVWGRGHERQVVTPTLTAGIRGTGNYTELFPGDRTYFCNCYGTIDLSDGGDQITSVSEYHQSFWAEPAANARGRMFTPARAINHTDEELENLAALAGERTAWQVAGRKGEHNGSGYMDPAQVHPLMR
jgi:hypothetical protein